MSWGGGLCRLQPGNTGEILQPRLHLPNSLKPDTLMKTQQSKLNVILIFTAAADALFLAGCESRASANTTSLLTAAGFRARTPQTPKQQQIYAALTPYQVQRATIP